MASNGESGIQKLFNKLKGYFVSKSNSSDVYGNSENITGDMYKPGLVPVWTPAISSNSFLRSDGIWKQPFGIFSGKLTNCSSSKTYSVTCPSSVYGSGKRYIEIYNADGTLAGAHSISDNTATMVFTTTVGISSCTNTTISIFVGNVSSGTTFYWRCLCY